MAKINMTGRLLKWGNSYGVRLSKADVDAAGLHVGDTLHVQLSERSDRVDLADLPVFHWGGGGSMGHDKLLDKARKAKLEARR